MDREQQVEVSVLVGSGEFTFRLNGVSLNVRLRERDGCQTAPRFEIKSLLPAAGGDKGAAAALAAPPGESADDASRLAEEVAYYRQASQEIYEGLGRLAKEINLSIKDLSLAELIQSNMTSPGERLDQVRSQVADVLEMTEKATLNILNLVEHIREDCVKVQGHLTHLAEANGGPKDPAEAAAEAPDPQGAAALWALMVDQGKDLDQKIREQFSPAGPAKTPPGRVALSDMLQLLLEFCGNEAVKPHVKSVLAKYESFFQVDEAEQSLALLAAELPQDGDLCEFPVDKVLSILAATCTDERIKELFAKLLASADKIFPTPSFPLEIQPQESPATSTPPEFAVLWQKFFENFQKLAGNIQEGPLCSHSGSDGELQRTAQEALASVEHIHTSLSGITEALAFQDLSGQRLLKVLNILRQLQVQVLTLLVAAGNKLKASLEGQEKSFTPSELSAQEELDRMLHTCTTESPGVSETPTAEQPLDQEAINELLTSMGF